MGLPFPNRPNDATNCILIISKYLNLLTPISSIGIFVIITSQITKLT